MRYPPVRRPALLPALAQDEWPQRVPVLIAGGGPVGLTAAMLLARQGIEVLLVDRRGPDARYPRAHLLNVRTMEIFHEIGVADDIYAQAPADDRWRKVVWYTSVAGPTPAARPQARRGPGLGRRAGRACGTPRPARGSSRICRRSGSTGCCGTMPSPAVRAGSGPARS